MLQSMVWCNELVTALAGLLRSIAHPSILAHESKRAAQRHIVHRMQVVTQPSIVSFTGGQPVQQGPKAAASTQPGLVDTAINKCKPRKMAGSTVADGQMLDVIKVSDIKHCRQRWGALHLLCAHVVPMSQNATDALL